jgi:hypothetical protein
MVQAWYQGGVSVFDFTDSAHPVEIAFFDRGPADATQLVTAGHWSAYWYNGYIYGAEIARGLDVFRLTTSDQLTKNELDAALQVRPRELNVQDQTKVAWPSSPSVARAYLDQLTRSKAIDAARAAAVKSAIDGMGKSKNGADVAGQLESAAAQASGPDAARLRALAALLQHP